MAWKYGFYSPRWKSGQELEVRPLQMQMYKGIICRRASKGLLTIGGATTQQAAGLPQEAKTSSSPPIIIALLPTHPSIYSIPHYKHQHQLTNHNIHHHIPQCQHDLDLHTSPHQHFKEVHIKKVRASSC